MTRDNADRLSRRTVLGTAGVAIAAPLIGDRPANGMVPLVPARPLASLTNLAESAGAQGVGTARGSLAAVIDGLPMEARTHGVVGDGRADDTRAVQVFLDLCAGQGGRIAYFGALSVRITGPVKSRGVGIVFDPAVYGQRGTPGFVADGEGYTALTVTGSIADFCVTVTGGEGADITEDGRIDRDRRPRINGIAFGTDDEPMGMSTVRAVRVNNLAGFGVRHAQCWDSLFLSISIERCGRDGVYAFEVAGDPQRTCNETTWARVQVEQSIGGAIRIDPGTLSCSFVKIHSERAIVRGPGPTWLFGGSCLYDSVRLTAANPVAATVSIVGNQMEFRNLRAEGGIPVTVNASGGTISFHSPGAVLQPARDQNGIVNIIGGVVSVLDMGGGWNLLGCQVERLEVGFMSAGVCSTLTGCTVGELLPKNGSDQGELVLSATRVSAATVSGAGRLRALHLRDDTQLASKGGTLACTDQTITVDASSQIIGNLVVQRAALRLAGTVTGVLSVRGPVHDVRAENGAVARGGVTGWGPPSVPGTPGAWSANLGLGSDNARGGRRQAVVGWHYVARAWRPVQVDIEG